MLNILLAIVVSASIDSTMIMLGDQTDMHLRVVCDPTEKVQMPQIGEQLMDGIEVVKTGKIDTTQTPDGQCQLTQTITLTSFKDSLYAIPPVAFVSGKDTLRSEAMSLNVVQPFEMDTTAAITDIKDREDVPIWWWGVIRWVLLGLLIAGVIGGIVYIIIKLTRKNQNPEEEIKVPLRPAEEVAMEKLQKIEAEKIWQQGEIKQYQTELTDVLREYIGRRFGVMSTEKTSDETLREVKPILTGRQKLAFDIQNGPELYEQLKKMLQLADLVKFAKWTTTPEENEEELTTAYRFVKETTPEPEAKVES
ncbi:MAG: hypothetical protein II170_01480 [Bacteroidaceae bacterium]|nr:hypothetical protein [Bacteroidaceae bacterium]